MFELPRRKAISFDSTELVEIGDFGPEQALPRKITPRQDDVDIAGWVTHNRPIVTDLMHDAGALLFRGFGLDTVERFARFARALCPDLAGYTERTSPRKQLAPSVYTSTEHPRDQYIQFHNANSYAHRWPRKIWFCCLTPPEAGGRTPIADCRSVLGHLEPRLAEEFASRGVSYLRNFRRGIGLSWQETFQTEDPAEVRRYCGEARIEIELFEADRLRTRQRRHAIAHHHTTRVPSWFNQAHLFHTRGLDPVVADSLRRTYAEEDLPRHAYFGDGAAIPDRVIDDIVQAYRKAEVSFDWQRGDVMLLDNMLVAHARTPFSGQRLIAVTFAELYQPAVAA
jgi:alpha-ketoglutarate-dependent taurine dioxygenase